MSTKKSSVDSFSLLSELAAKAWADNWIEEYNNKPEPTPQAKSIDFKALKLYTIQIGAF